MVQQVRFGVGDPAGVAGTVVVQADHVMTGRECLSPGWVLIEGTKVGLVGAGPSPWPMHLAMPPGHALAPAFVDIHVHGGGGGDFASADAGSTSRALSFHQRHGTGTCLASLASADYPEMREQMSVLQELVRKGDLAGIHLEGPWLSLRRAGAHSLSALRSPERAQVAAMLKAGGGAIRMITLAPELPGALDAIRMAVDAGVVVALGHTDATYSQTKAAIDAGATVATHLFNGMRPIGHREPGPVVALLEDDRVTVELIADGVHLADSIVRSVIRWVGARRVALVTDAISAAGMPGGEHRLGQQRIQVVKGTARIGLDGSLAGSVLTMNAALQHFVSRHGIPIADAVRMTTTTPARALRLEHRGTLAPLCAADLVVLDASYAVVATMLSGRWLPTEAATHK